MLRTPRAAQASTASGRGLGRDGDDGKVRHVGRVGDGGVGCEPLNLCRARIDRVNGAGKAVLPQKLDRPATDFGRIL